MDWPNLFQAVWAIEWAVANNHSGQYPITNWTPGNADGVEMKRNIRDKKKTRYQCQGGSQYQPDH